MNNADLVWRLAEMLLEKEKDSNQVIDEAKNTEKSNRQKQDEV